MGADFYQPSFTFLVHVRRCPPVRGLLVLLAAPGIRAGDEVSAPAAGGRVGAAKEVAVATEQKCNL